MREIEKENNKLWNKKVLVRSYMTSEKKIYSGMVTCERWPRQINVIYNKQHSLDVLLSLYRMVMFYPINLVLKMQLVPLRSKGLHLLCVYHHHIYLYYLFCLKIERLLLTIDLYVYNFHFRLVHRVCRYMKYLLITAKWSWCR